MNYQIIEQSLKEGYREASSRYRQDDEIEVTTENHRRISTTLKRICRSFPYETSVLEVGCGTGRYFHCLNNVRELVGIDISDDMLRAAENPVRQEEVTVPSIQLRRANAYLIDFPAQSFDFIYSLGMFGDGCAVTSEIIEKFYEWLRPGGKLFFNVVDFDGLPLLYRAKRQARNLLYPMLTRHWQSVLDERESKRPFFGITRRRLETILQQTRFRDFEITSYPCESPLGWGRHLECIASKPA